MPPVTLIYDLRLQKQSFFYGIVAVNEKSLSRSETTNYTKDLFYLKTAILKFADES